MTRRQARRPSSGERRLEDQARAEVKTKTGAVVTALLVLVVLAFVLIPVVRVLVLGYRWALS